jgi:hypothetical protein
LTYHADPARGRAVRAFDEVARHVVGYVLSALGVVAHGRAEDVVVYLLAVDVEFVVARIDGLPGAVFVSA